MDMNRKSVWLAVVATIGVILAWGRWGPYGAGAYCFEKRKVLSERELAEVAKRHLKNLSITYGKAPMESTSKIFDSHCCVVKWESGLFWNRVTVTTDWFFKNDSKLYRTGGGIMMNACGASIDDYLTTNEEILTEPK